MSIALFIISGVFAFWHYVTIGRVVFALPGFIVTVWIAWMLSSIAVSGLFSIRARDETAIRAWCALVAVFIGNHLAWSLSRNPVVTIGALHLCASLWFATVARERFEVAISAIYALSSVVALTTIAGIIPGAGQRQKLFVALSHPDIIALASHCAHMILGSANDGGRIVRNHYNSGFDRGFAAGRVLNRYRN